MFTFLAFLGAATIGLIVLFYFIYLGLNGLYRIYRGISDWAEKFDKSWRQ